MIDVNMLLAWGASYKHYEAGEFVFKEGTSCAFYFQLVVGKVRWVNLNDEGKEYIQTIIEPGECFGEIPLFDDGPYAATAITSENSLVIRLPKKIFVQILLENPEINFSFSKLLSQRLRYKFMLLKAGAFDNPEKRITELLVYIKNKANTTTPKKYQVDLTRQEIANMTGLRVETVIRSIRSLKDKGELVIDRGKVYL